VYDSELNDEDVTFGTSGFLYQNNKLMYDRTTNSLWHSLTGEPVVGDLAESGTELEQYPVTVTTWSAWLELHPETTVVDIETGFRRRYLDPSEIGSAYFEYRASPDAMFPTFEVDGRLSEKDNVVGVSSNGESLAFPIDLVIAEGVINSVIDNVDLVVIGHPDRGLVGVFERDGLRFSRGDDASEIIDGSGMIWTIADGALESKDGRSLALIPSRELFWFAWRAFFPQTKIYEGTQVSR